jgi:hypothetical protein
MTIKFQTNEKGAPAGKLADAELHFSGGPLDGLKLVGFAVWERKAGGRNVTMPARQYSVNGERRSYALLRPIVDATSQDKLRDLIVDAYKERAELAAAPKRRQKWAKGQRVKRFDTDERHKLRTRWRRKQLYAPLLCPLPPRLVA